MRPGLNIVCGIFFFFTFGVGGGAEPFELMSRPAVSSRGLDPPASSDCCFGAFGGAIILRALLTLFIFIIPEARASLLLAEGKDSDEVIAGPAPSCASPGIDSKVIARVERG